MFKIFSDRRLLLLALILALSNIIITGVSIYIIYNKSMSVVNSSLHDMVESQKSLLTALHEQGSSRDKIIQLVKKMREKHNVIGNEGEFVIAQKIKDSIVFLVSSQEKLSLSFNNKENLAFPMRLALLGNSGTINSKDYAGTNVLAAYTYEPVLKWGIVAKVPCAEVKKPFLSAFLVATIIFIILLSFSIFLFVKISNPIVKSIFDSEDKFRRAIQMSPYPIMIHCEDGEVLNISKGWKIITGYDYNDIPTIDKWTELAYGSNKNQVKTHIQTLYHLKESHDEGEYKIKCKNGEERIWDFSSTSIGKLYNGKKAVISIAKDVTERKKEEDRRKEAEAKFSTIFQSSPVAYSLYDMDWKLIEVNLAFCQMTGYSNEEVIGKTTRELGLISDQEQQRILQVMNKQDGTFDNFEVNMTIRNGSILPIILSRKIIYINNIPHRLGTAIDISQRVEAEILLKEKNNEIESQIEEYRQINEELQKTKERAEQNEARFKAITEKATDGITLTDLSGNYIFVNPAFCKLLGYTDSKLLTMNITDVLAKDEIIKAFTETISNGQGSRLNVRLIASNKSIIYTDIYGKLININNEKLVLGIIHDVTERYQFENELISAKEHAEESDHLKTAFLQNMSHEIRTPMNAIMGFSDLLSSNYNNKEKIEHYSAIIKQRCNDLLDIINDILDISKIESNQLPLNIEDCELDILFDDLKTFFTEHQTKINKQHIEFAINTPDVFHGAILSTDKVKLKQIFINLINNAFKFTNNGKIECGCKIGENNQLTFYVSDTGIGISPDKHQYIFERFTQIYNNSPRNCGGTGLGLPIVKGLVEFLGGKVWLDSEVGKGTTFYFTVNAEFSRQVHELKSTENQTINNFLFDKKTILIVEDDPYNMAFIKEVLIASDATLLYAENGKDAIRETRDKNPDIVLLDIGLPDMLGYDVVRHLISQNPDIKIIAQTAYASDNDRLLAIKSGCIDYISKPLNTHKLLSLINKYIS